ncbi:MAG TPA: hypothetical protein PK865_01690 [Candidatus Saccharibacteria bacterium]|nr:hypothetical protein [Candidatus Saccharibacteria bacterium]
MSEQFIYNSFAVQEDKKTVLFNFSLNTEGANYDFTESLKFPVDLRDTPAIKNSLRALHIALGISYYKTFTPPTITHPYAMDDAEADFWNHIWRGGLGEFLYVNQVSPEKLAEFIAQEGQPPAAGIMENYGGEGAILGIGGGKDSIVAGELLKGCSLPFDGFVMATGEQRGQAQAVADIMGKKLYVIERKIDPLLLEVQELPGALKGHIPISLIFGLVGTVLGLALGKKYVVVANEASASTPRLAWGYGVVNHQWSKALNFEQMLQEYTRSHITKTITYFSAVRQLTSVGVAKIFSHFKQYFEVFTSDNFVFRINPSDRPNQRWSLESPKSLSSFLLLLPWLNESEMLRIFGRNLLDESSLENLFWELLGIEGTPPLDCVGTSEELMASLQVAAAQGKFSSSTLMQAAGLKGILNDTGESHISAMLALQPEDALPTELHEEITTWMEQYLK